MLSDILLYRSCSFGKSDIRHSALRDQACQFDTNLDLPTPILKVTQACMLHISLPTCRLLSILSSSASCRECLRIYVLAVGSAHRVKTRSYCCLTRLTHQLLGFVVEALLSNPPCWTKHKRTQLGMLFTNFAFDLSTHANSNQCTHITAPLESIDGFQTLHSPDPRPYRN